MQDVFRFKSTNYYLGVVPVPILTFFIFAYFCWLGYQHFLGDRRTIVHPIHCKETWDYVRRRLRRVPNFHEEEWRAQTALFNTRVDARPTIRRVGTVYSVFLASDPC